MNNILVSCGRSGLRVKLDPAWQVEVIRKPTMPVLPDPVATLEAALAAPVGAPPLAQLAAGAKSACIVICDVTRPVPNGLILPVLVRQLLAAGLPAEGITVLIATGLHRPNEGAEQAAVVGDEWVMKTVRVVNHFARRDDEHVTLGTTTRGTPVRLDRRLIEADLRIVVGLVEPHFMAGYSGGRKLLAPGIAHADTITSFHHARLVEHPDATSARIDGNPLHDELLQIAAMAGRVFAVNTVLDEERRVTAINFGGLLESHAAAVECVRPYAERRMARRYGVVLTSSAGFPLDLTYYQTVKGMVAALGALRPGGKLFIVSECAEGLGSAEFRAAQRQLVCDGAEKFMQHLLALPRAPVDAWQTEMLCKALRHGEVHLCSPGLPASDWPDTAVHRARDLDRELAAAVAASGENALAVIPEGPYVIPL
jgi:nickel-dependent lactate racemase